MAQVRTWPGRNAAVTFEFEPYEGLSSLWPGDSFSEHLRDGKWSNQARRRPSLATHPPPSASRLPRSRLPRSRRGIGHHAPPPPPRDGASDGSAAMVGRALSSLPRAQVRTKYRMKKQITVRGGAVACNASVPPTTADSFKCSDVHHTAAACNFECLPSACVTQQLEEKLYGRAYQG